jgi:hypothetical protein
MIRRLLTFAAIVGVCAAGIACSDNSGSKIIPPKTENTKLPSEASAGSGGASKGNQPAVNPNPPSGGTSKQD